MEMQLEKKKLKLPVQKVLLWISIASMVMLFAGLTSGYVVRRAEGNWLFFELPQAFYFSTAIILLSSIPMQLALNAARKGNKGLVKTMTIVTLGMGLIFTFLQFYGWENLVHQGIFFADKNNPSGSFFYVLSGLHLAHLAGGLIALLVVGARAILEKYGPENYLGIELCTQYWHFLGGLWLYLFVFLAVYR